VNAYVPELDWRALKVGSKVTIRGECRRDRFIRQDKSLLLDSSFVLSATEGKEPPPNVAVAVEKVLLGTWKVTVGPQFETEWTFQRGGVVKSSKGQPQGRWAIEEQNKRVLLSWNEKDWESLNLPLDEKRTSGKSSHDAGWVIVATKLRGPDVKDKVNPKAAVYKTPQEVFDAFETADAKSDRPTLVRCLAPESQKELAIASVVGFLNRWQSSPPPRRTRRSSPRRSRN